MDLDQLHTFLEIVRLKSFSKAAQSCFRTQPAVSAQVRQLEQDLSAPLFERLGTKIALTPAGRIFADYAEQILELRRRAQNAISELERTPRGELVIAANEATCIYVLPRVFLAYKKLFPNVEILVDRSYGARVVEAVVDNQADFGITQLPVKEKRLEVAKIHSDEIKLIVPPGHPLAGKKEILPSDLIGEPLLLPKAGTTRSRLTAWLEHVADELHVSMELDSTEKMKRFVMTGLGASFLAATHCREEVAAGRLAAISLGPEPMVRQVALIYRRDKALSKAALGFINIVLEHAAMVGGRLALRPAAAAVGDRVTKVGEG
jgi:DNA-binding transcriptional LysR family regulator